MIDKIIRIDFHTYVIILMNRPPITISSSGNALVLLEYFLNGAT